MEIVINVNCENVNFHFVTFFIDILFKIPTNKLITRKHNTFCNLYLYKTNMIEPFNLVKATKIQI